MNNEQLFIRLYISVVDKWLFDPKKQYIALVYIFLCRQANIGNKITEYQGIKILPWNVATTRKIIAEKLNITENKTRYALKVLEKNGYIRIDRETAKNKFLIIRIAVINEKTTDPKTAETLDMTGFEEKGKCKNHRPKPKTTDQITDQTTDPKTAETLAALALKKIEYL